jgi:hypothetical protein
MAETKLPANKLPANKLPANKLPCRLCTVLKKKQEFPCSACREINSSYTQCQVVVKAVLQIFYSPWYETYEIRELYDANINNKKHLADQVLLKESVRKLMPSELQLATADARECYRQGNPKFRHAAKLACDKSFKQQLHAWDDFLTQRGL